jgi:hypothetical protein
MKRLIWIFPVLVLTIAIAVNSCKDAILQPNGLGSEATMSSPILQLGESWQGNMAGLIDVTANYDTLTNTVYGTIKNVSSRKLCWALSEPHMKLGTQTVGELGPEKLGHLLPGQLVNTSLSVFDDPKYTGYTFDGYVLHMEVFDCSGGAPSPY